MSANICPYCGGVADAHFVDIGVGFEQVTPFECAACLSRQQRPDEWGLPMTEEERRTGWWKPETSEEAP